MKIGPPARPPIAWLTVADVATHLGINEATVYRLVRGRKIGHTRLGAGKGRAAFTNADAHLASVTIPARVPEEEELQPGLHVPSKWLRLQGSKPVAKVPRKSRTGG